MRSSSTRISFRDSQYYLTVEPVAGPSVDRRYAGPAGSLLAPVSLASLLRRVSRSGLPVRFDGHTPLVAARFASRNARPFPLRDTLPVNAYACSAPVPGPVAEGPKRRANRLVLWKLGRRERLNTQTPRPGQGHFGENRPSTGEIGPISSPSQPNVANSAIPAEAGSQATERRWN